MKTIRVSTGSAARLGLKQMRMNCLPTTVYLLTPGVCKAKCLFCSQRVNQERLSRVQWPEYPLKKVISCIKKERVCIQCLNYDKVFSDVFDLVNQLNATLNGNPISLSAQPFSEDQLKQLKGNVDRISINLDCATPELFSKIKPYYTWEDHLSRLLYAREIFGPFRASTHLIVGLGETEAEMVKIMQFLYYHEISSSLFAFTPIKGTPLEGNKKPDITYYRRMQVAHYLIYKGNVDFKFDKGKITALDMTVPPEAFMTRGCPGCNRPYYTETPRNVYNFPSMPDENEMNLIRDQLKTSL